MFQIKILSIREKLDIAISAERSKFMVKLVLRATNNFSFVQLFLQIAWTHVCKTNKCNLQFCGRTLFVVILMAMLQRPQKCFKRTNYFDERVNFKNRRWKIFQYFDTWRSLVLSFSSKLLEKWICKIHYTCIYIV